MREEAKEKLLEIVNTETEHSEQFEKSTLVENDDHTKTTASASEGGCRRSCCQCGSAQQEAEMLIGGHNCRDVGFVCYLCRMSCVTILTL